MDNFEEKPKPKKKDKYSLVMRKPAVVERNGEFFFWDGEVTGRIMESDQPGEKIDVSAITTKLKSADLERIVIQAGIFSEDDLSPTVVSRLAMAIARHLTGG